MTAQVRKERMVKKQAVMPAVLAFKKTGLRG